jgi:1-pyrroline-5-carboxylate dehydrogenase
MSIGIFNVPAVKNEPVKNYGPGSPEKIQLKRAIAEARSKVIEIPQYIGGGEIYSQNKKPVSPPHDHQHILGYFHEGDQEDVKKAINAALDARKTGRP